MARRSRSAILCGYRLMWLMVMFDLPVDTEEERKLANGFRKLLLDFGFERCQYSVYLRFCESRQQVETWIRRVGTRVPKGGKVYCLTFTDKQYEGLVRFENRMRLPPPENPTQFRLF